MTNVESEAHCSHLLALFDVTKTRRRSTPVLSTKIHCGDDYRYGAFRRNRLPVLKSRTDAGS